MRYRFDGFELDQERYELRRGTVVQHIEPLVFDLLHFLVRNGGRVLARDEIVDAVWQGRAVSEATISSCIKSARRALGDSGESQSAIRTVRGRGFEFTLPVTRIDCAAPAAAAPAVPGAAPSPHEASPPTPEAAASANAGTVKPVLAVLPFTNLSADVENYFALGLAEDIITNLSRFRDLRVIAGTSTFQLKAQGLDLGEICRRLNARYVVEGSVRRAAGRLRISVQLIDGPSRVHLWGERYDREMGDLFDLQDEVTRTIAATLGVKIQDVALQQAMTKKQNELDAYDCLLRARRYTWMLSAEAHAEARDLLEKAVELDPMSADAHALLANVYLGEHRFDMNPRPNAIGRALVHALAATRLDPQNAYARCWLAIVHFFRGENARFVSEAELALSLNPNDPETLADIGHYYAFMGEFQRGADLSRRARALNPLHPGWYHFSLARLHFHQKKYEEAIADVERGGLPDFYWTRLLLGAAKGHLGWPDAKDEIAAIFALKPGFCARAELKKWNAEARDSMHILEGLRKAGLRE